MAFFCCQCQGICLFLTKVQKVHILSIENFVFFSLICQSDSLQKVQKGLFAFVGHIANKGAKLLVLAKGGKVGGKKFFGSAVASRYNLKQGGQVWRKFARFHFCYISAVFANHQTQRPCWKIGFCSYYSYSSYDLIDVHFCLSFSFVCVYIVTHFFAPIYAFDRIKLQQKHYFEDFQAILQNCLT